MRERTYLQEAEFRLANTLTWLDSSYHNLYLLLDIAFPDTYIHTVFVKDAFLERLNFYIERAPVNSPFTESALGLIHNHVYRNSLVVFQSDFPNSRLWNYFDNFLCTLLYGDSGMIASLPYQIMYATRGHGMLKLIIGHTWAALRELVQGYRHDCCQDAVFEQLVLPEKMSWSLFDSMLDQQIHKPITPTGSYRCPSCGEESIITVLNMRKLKRMHERHVRTVQSEA
jgi:hypothetical protein